MEQLEDAEPSLSRPPVVGGRRESACVKEWAASIREQMSLKEFELQVSAVTKVAEVVEVKEKEKRTLKRKINQLERETKRLKFPLASRGALDERRRSS